MEAISIIIVIALLIEAAVETGRMALEGGIRWQNVASALLGVGLAWACNVGLLAAIGIAVPFWVDILLTGVLLSRGSNFISDLFDRLKQH